MIEDVPPGFELHLEFGDAERPRAQRLHEPALEVEEAQQPRGVLLDRELAADLARSRGKRYGYAALRASAAARSSGRDTASSCSDCGLTLVAFPVSCSFAAMAMLLFEVSIFYCYCGNGWQSARPGGSRRAGPLSTASILTGHLLQSRGLLRTL